MKIEVSFSAPVQGTHQETTPSTILGFRSNHHQVRSNHYEGFLTPDKPEDQVKLEQKTISDVVEFFRGLFGRVLKSTVFVDGGKLSHGWPFVFMKPGFNPRRNHSSFPRNRP